MSLKVRAFSAVRWTAVASASRVALQLVQVAVLARLLTPEDYGLMAMTTVVVSFAAIFSDLGLNSAFLQRRDISQEQRSSLYWGNILMSLGVAAGLVLASPLIAILFDDERISPLIMLSATTIVIAALGQQLRVKAEKDLDFGPLVQVEILAGLAGFASALTCAWLGYGVYALVWGAIVNAVAASALSWLRLARGWRPGWHFRPSDIRSFMGFGGSMMGSGIVGQINMNIDLLLGGRLLEAAQLGYYSLPRGLVLQVQFLVNPIITRVGFPLIAEIQHDLKLVKDVYLKTLNLAASVNAPVYVGLMFLAPDVVMLVFGSKWTATGELLQILAGWGLLRSIGNPVGSLLLGTGRADLAFKWNVAKLLTLPPVLWCGAQSGVQGLAWALLLYAIAILIPTWFVLVRPTCKATMKEYFVAAFKPVCLALITIAPVCLVFAGASDFSIRLAGSIVVSAALYLVASYYFNRYWIESMVQLMVKKRTDESGSV